jgi:hypothetical protein
LVQRVAALHDALVLSPDNPLLHHQLALTYQGMHLLDAALAQYDLAARGYEASGTRGAVSPDVVKAVAAGRDQLREEVERRLKSYELKAAGQPHPLAKVHFAISDPYPFIGNDNKKYEDPRGRGLPLEALRVLQSIDPASLPVGERIPRTMLLVQINLELGRIGDAVTALGKADQELQQASPNVTLAAADARLMIWATTGWYKKIDETTEAIENMLLEGLRTASRDVVIDGFALGFVGPKGPLPRLQLEDKLRGIRDVWLRTQPVLADLRTLRGIFLVECGESEEALRQLDLALASKMPFAERRIAERYAELLRRYAKK